MTDLVGPLSDPDGATPLGPEEMAGLIPTWPSTRDELNIIENENVTAAMLWAFGQKWTVKSLLNDVSVRGLHRRMFGDVWKWAGERRERETSIGVAPAQIGVQLLDLLEDVRVQVAAPPESAMPADEIAARFHHRLVQIHPFPNGNGRHARLAADLLVVTLGRPRFTWGGVNLTSAGETRSTYLDALRAADSHSDYGPLLAFARS